jgi:cyclic beta-1,2-glucan synthetase
MPDFPGIGKALRQALWGLFQTREDPVEEPIRAELFSIERLELLAVALAESQTIDPSPNTDTRLAWRLRDNQRALGQAYKATILAVHEACAITPAADWLVNNFHVVEEQIREIRVDLPPGFYRELPKLRDGPFAGYPRVFGLAWTFVAHTDSRFDPHMLCRFLHAYQHTEPLAIRELWAVAISLRLVLVENLRRLAVEIAQFQAARQRANLLADRLLGTGGREAEPVAKVVASLNGRLPDAFAVQLVQRLREQDPRVLPALQWLEKKLEGQGTDAASLVHAEQMRHGAVNVTIRNVITSMQLMSAIDWRELVESVSLVDETLRVGSDFAAMDFVTRDLYRRAIEDLARGSAFSEIDIARRALLAAHETAPGGESPAENEVTASRKRDPGYYLIARGRRAFEQSLAFQLPMSRRLARANATIGISGYISLVCGVCALVMLPLLWSESGHNDFLHLTLLALLALIPASDVAVTLVNCGATHRFNAKILPGLSLENGVAEELRTLVVMPTLLTSPATILAQIERLESHFLANDDGDLSFVMLSDWTDSPNESAADDKALLDVAIAAIAALNRRYAAAPGGDRFLLLHRRRLFNKQQGQWIGWERKRGKLHELNRLLRGANDTSFLPLEGQKPTVPVGVRYVIVLDADTRLPRDTAKKLIGKIAHPLNRPVLDPASRRVVEGYAVLQPRVTAALPNRGEGSLFQRVFSSASGMDPYACAVSDVYQDLFGEGSYCGKGIYEVDLFEAALAGRIPDNTLLSHDLLEGIFARAGLVSDIEVIEEFPARYDVAVARQSRWARGDWQLLPWLLGGSITKDGTAQSQAIPMVGRWKMFDNLRRSLSAPACFLALLAGWTLSFASPWRWTLFVLATIALPAVIPLLGGVVPRRFDLSLRVHTRAVALDMKMAAWQILLLLVFLADQAWIMVSAVFRTLFRLVLSHRNLLEWVTAAQAKLRPRRDVAGFYRQMAGSLALGGLALVAVLAAGPRSWLCALPIIALWLAAPLVARWSSLPTALRLYPPLTGNQQASLRQVARRTWHFFETFVTAADHWLPPDNFQEEPLPVIAHRTSPTNMGLYLLAVTAARDFGWIGLNDMVERLEASFDSLSRLERFRGHFYNWYATLDLHALEPKYVSSVDSGNLAGNLICLWHACDEACFAPLVDPDWRTSLQDCVQLLRQALVVGGADLHLSITPALSEIERTLGEATATPSEVAILFDRLLGQANGLQSSVAALDQAAPEQWATALTANLRSRQRDLALIRPLVDLRAPLCQAIPSLATLPDLAREAIARLTAEEPRQPEAELALAALRQSAERAEALRARLTRLAARSRAFFAEMKFDFLFDKERELLSIGYRVADGVLDPNYYDLLASEARLASFLAIAKGEVPTRHWSRLGRTQVPIAAQSVLVSWSGSMFEYLMPRLMMLAPDGSLLEQTGREAVRQHIAYGLRRSVPWGVSESAFNARDLEFTYQYSGFGIPDLALKRGIGDDTVIAPYATGLAAMIDPIAAVENFARLAQLGASGRYGWYEALDYTKSRLPDGEAYAIIRSFMAHHQGMTIIALADATLDGQVTRRFHAEPMILATELLLQERVARDVARSLLKPEPRSQAINIDILLASTQRRILSPHTRWPRCALLSNGAYAVMITAAGSGYSRWHDIAVTRWREDPTCDDWGSYILIRDLRSNEIFSAGYQPTATEAKSYEVAFSEGRAEFCRQDGSLRTMLEVAVSSEDDAEVRRLSITNLGSQARDLELTSYAEIVLNSVGADDAHPAFSNLFVETEFVSEFGTIIATRRLQKPADLPACAAHLMVVEGETMGDLQYETDRARFLGRGRGLRRATAMVPGARLSNTVGVVLDPIFALRRQVRIPPRTTLRVAFWTMIAATRAEVIDLADKHRSVMAFDRATTLAWTQAQVQLRHLGISAGQAHLFQRLAAHILYANATLRPSSEVLQRGGFPLSLLWSQGISGDLPIVLLRIDDDLDLELVRQLLLAHEYWRMKQLPVDLVILNERPPSYAEDFQATLEGLLRAAGSLPKARAVQGAVFILRADALQMDLRNLLETIARAVLVGHRGTLTEQVIRTNEPAPVPQPRRAIGRNYGSTPAPALPPLLFFNGTGGFSEDGKEYWTILGDGHDTPAPWINVVSNQQFGFLASAEGGGYCWSLDSQQNQITPWSNDPVADRPGDIIYLRDEDSGVVWGPTALPIRQMGVTYIARHGQGYSRFQQNSQGLSLDLLIYVASADPIKIARLRIKEASGRARRLSVTAYVEWVLGVTRKSRPPSVVTVVDNKTGALMATNPFSEQYGGRVAFADLAGRQTSVSGDRTEFLGRHGSLDRPLALATSQPLSNHVGAGLDPCAALQTKVELAANGAIEIVYFLGEAASLAEAQDLILSYRSFDLEAVFREVTSQWEETLGAIQVTTPDPSMDLLVNRWLIYQTLVCRVWARAGFYQASGAYGFRDQLQDGMALAVARPAETRAHLLRAASRQFVEGDAQHWWLPNSGRGIRTRISDDLIWLPFAMAHYVALSGDHGVLDELVGFVEGPALKPGEGESFFQPTLSGSSATLFEHGARALDHSLATGIHGLPLIGTGDWNDGMNRVGEEGRGESVWLGWFLHAALTDFALLADQRGERDRAERWRKHAASLALALERDGWDGAWYRRAFYDDGSPLGSAGNDECKIDAIAQSWSVISRVGDPARAVQAMAAVEQYLIRKEEGLALLFTPPFDKTVQDPGYIKGYPPGIRENGGQYTHAATWSVIALAMQGEGDKAHAMFSMLNPINHAATPEAVQRYRVEPYVVCADIYSVAPQVGRGGWTWYTGSSGWMYRAAVESILGFTLRGSVMLIDPTIPRDWPGFSLRFRYHAATYQIEVTNPRSVCRGVVKLTLDGVVQTDGRVQLVKDEQIHQVAVELG